MKIIAKPRLFRDWIHICSYLDELILLLWTYKTQYSLVAFTHQKKRKPPKFVKLHYPNSFEFYNNQQIDFLYGCNIRILDLTTNGEEGPRKKCFDIILVNPNT